MFIYPYCQESWLILAALRRWNYDKQRRLEEKDKREEEKQKHTLEMDLLRADLENKKAQSSRK